MGFRIILVVRENAFLVKIKGHIFPSIIIKKAFNDTICLNRLVTFNSYISFGGGLLVTREYQWFKNKILVDTSHSYITTQIKNRQFNLL